MIVINTLFLLLVLGRPCWQRKVKRGMKRKAIQLDDVPAQTENLKGKGQTTSQEKAVPPAKTG
jgi:hypothetical protein